jgi:hypothetical protein
LKPRLKFPRFIKIIAQIVCSDVDYQQQKEGQVRFGEDRCGSGIWLWASAIAD